MIEYKCDRCGIIIGSDMSRYGIKIDPPEYYSSIFYRDVFDRDIHLCSDCMEKFIDFLGELGRSKI